MNASRRDLAGINRKPLPDGRLVQLPDGRLSLVSPGGKLYQLRKNGTLLEYIHGRDRRLRFAADGSVNSVHTPNLSAVRVPGRRELRVTWHPDPDTTVVSLGPGHGYVEHTVHQNGKAYLQRTYLHGKTVTTRTLVKYHSNSVPLAYYPPRTFYPPGFYGWAYEPWSVGASWQWGWRNAAWYRGGFILFASVYTGPAPWLADFILGETEEDAEADEALPPAADASTDPQTPGVDDGVGTLQAAVTTPYSEAERATLVDEVVSDVAQDANVATDPTVTAEIVGLDKVLQAGHVFLVDDTMEATAIDAGALPPSPFQATCSLSAGDLITVSEVQHFPRNPRAYILASGLYPRVELLVTASRKHDCPVGTKVVVGMDALQEMDNSFRAHLDEGMAALYDAQGTQGMPAAPHDAVALLPMPNGLLPKNDTAAAAAAAQLNEAQIQADQAEKQLEAEAFSSHLPSPTATGTAVAEVP